MRQEPVISVKEARKQLGKDYRVFSDEQVLEIITLLNVVAKDAVQSMVPD